MASVRACLQVDALTNPDLQIVSKPRDRNFIPVERFIGDREHRMSEGLCHDISLKPHYGGRKIAIIDDADFLNQEGANCLLKTLEEPPPKSLLILIGTSEQRAIADNPLAVPGHSFSSTSRKYRGKSATGKTAH